MEPILQEAEISLENIHYTIPLCSLPWLLKQPVAVLTQTKLTKKNIHPLIYQEKLYNTQENTLTAPTFKKMAPKIAKELVVEQYSTMKHPNNAFYKKLPYSPPKPMQQN